MDKEQFMKASQLGWIVVLATMIGCGNNGDPGKNYSGVKSQATVKANPGEPTMIPAPVPVVQPAPAPLWDCNNQFKVTVEKDALNKVLQFTEDTEATYTIIVNSNLGPDFKVETANLTPGLSNDLHSGRAKFNTLSTTGSIGTYSFTWKPGKVHNGLAELQPLTLKFTSLGQTAICSSAKTDTLNLLVQPQAQNTGAAK